MKKRAIVYCENQFGTTDGKTANGLIREPGNYTITAVIDSSKHGQDACMLLDNKWSGIPVCKDLEDALIHSGPKPDDFIFGIAPANAFLKPEERKVILQAMEAGLNIINPLQEFLTEDEEMAAHAKACGVTIRDIRKPRPKKEWTLFTGEILKMNTPVVAVLGTDGACGKRTTAKCIEKAFMEKGYRPAFIATGQTGLIQGAKYGFAMDAFPLQYLIGELEREILRANKEEHPDLIIVEGQGALSHPAYASSTGILKGARPQAVILQHAPKRKYLSDFPFAEVPKVEDEISLIEHFGKTRVIGITLNHDGMSDRELEETIRRYEETYHLPVTDVLKTGTDKIINALLDFFPSLKKAVVS
ncbi:DUF1611 domain-containing protein [Heyndrickxia coagulans]|uniref:DUF1611 domain-containing protein n=1 Tax=Heyndrickxia coagulans TaxID=1398 RepID=UPI0023E3C1E3|nr:DUF1611 domain-containing protein [Heyndrickxia coagulans]